MKNNNDKNNKDNRELQKQEQDKLDIVELLQRNADVIAELQAQNLTWARVSQSNTTLEMATVAKVLNYKSLGRNNLFEVLRSEGILRYNNEPYQEYIDRGYFGVIEQEVSTSYGGTIVNRKTVVTQKGIDHIRKILDKLGYENAN